MNGYSRIRPRLILPAILFLAITLRLLGISDRPIWYDESFSLLMAGHEPAEIVTASLGDDSNRAAEEHPPVYYFMLHGWFR
ncbi:MAG: hypothetical protein FJZ96_10790, partial [Chloroflexi bacterium]|nr:hypothetical protein [Chloroflexota bacterium]